MTIDKSYAALLKLQVEQKYEARIKEAEQDCKEIARARYQSAMKLLEAKKELLL